MMVEHRIAAVGVADHHHIDCGGYQFETAMVDSVGIAIGLKMARLREQAGIVVLPDEGCAWRGPYSPP